MNWPDFKLKPVCPILGETVLLGHRSQTASNNGHLRQVSIIVMSNITIFIELSKHLLSMIMMTKITIFLELSNHLLSDAKDHFFISLTFMRMSAFSLDMWFLHRVERGLSTQPSPEKGKHQ